MSEQRKLVCANCGAEMNHHAFKIDYGSDDPSLIDPVFGGVLKETYCCPECGRTDLLNAA